MSLLEIRHGRKIYGAGEGEIAALDNVSLTLEPGEFVCILGSSGSGKTTLLNTLGGLDTLTSGETLLNGKNYAQLKDEEMSRLRCESFGFIFQSYNLIPIFTVYENIITPVLLSKKAADEGYIDELLQMLGISGKKHAFPNQLSGGQQQRVAIARALANRPEVIFADEPTGNLDTTTGSEVIKLLMAGMKTYGHTLILVTHNERYAELADRVVVIENGRVSR